MVINMEKKQKDKKHLSKHKKEILKKKRRVSLLFMLGEVLIILFFTSIMIDTRPLTSEHVITVTVSTSDISWSKSDSRYGQSFKVEGHKYYIDKRHKGYFYNAVEAEEEVTLLVKAKRNIISLSRALHVVGIQSDDKVYLDLAKYNSYYAFIPYVYVPLFLFFDIPYVFLAVIYVKFVI